MERLFKGRALISFAERSLAPHVALVLVVAGLFTYIYWMHVRLTGFYERGRPLHQLSISTLSLSQEYYHTQLELYELFSAPDQKRVEDFFLHEKLFFELLEKTYLLFEENKNNVSPAVGKKLHTLRASVARVQKQWQETLEILRQTRPMKEKTEAMINTEKMFDDEHLNETIKEMVAIHFQETVEYDREIDRLIREGRKSVALGIMVAFLLVCVLTQLYRSALRGRRDEIQIVQAEKLASLGKLSAGMAHELNSPLMIIKGYNNRVISALKKRDFEPTSVVWDYLGEVDSGVERVTKIIKHVKDFARMSNFELATVSINDIIRRSFTLFEEPLRLAQIQIEFKLDKGAPLVTADANRIEQVLLNIISNARDALSDTAAGRKIIRVSSVVADGKVAVEFTDNGSGISKADLPRVFDPFFTTKPVGLGTGLGLSISAGIIRDHEGTLELESKIGNGTCVRITLPLAALSKMGKAA